MALAALLLLGAAGCNALLDNGYPPDEPSDASVLDGAAADGASAASDAGTDAGDAGRLDSGIVVVASVEAPEHLAVSQGIVFWTSNTSLGRIEADGSVTATPTFLAGTGPYPLALGGTSAVYVGGAFNGFLQVVVCSFDLVNCSSFRAFGSASTAAGIAAGNASAYVGTQTGLLSVVANGSTAWTASQAASAIANGQGHVYASHEGLKYVTIYDEADGAVRGHSPQTSSALLAIHVEGNTLALTTVDSGVYTFDTSAAADSGVTTVIASASNPLAVRVDATHVYWVEDPGTSPGTIRRCPLKGCNAGGPEILAAGLSHPRDLALDGPYVYWAVRGDGTPGSGEIMRRAR
jgi:hypothetical protein